MKLKKSGSLFVPQAPHLILRPWQDDTPVPPYHQVNNLVGYGSKNQSAAAGGAVTLTHQSTETAVGSWSNTFSSVAIGTGASDRIIIVACCAGNSIDFGGNPRVTSCTVRGNSANILADAYHDAGSSECQAIIFGILDTSANTTGDIAIGFNSSGGSNAQMNIVVYTVTGAGTDDTATGLHDSLTATNADPLTGTIDTAANGAWIACASLGNVNSSFTWTGPTERVDQGTASPATTRSWADDGATSSATGATCTADQASAGTANALAAITYAAA